MKKEKKVKMFSEDEIVKAYQKVYKRCITAIRKKKVFCTFKTEREEQTFIVLAALRRELGIL